MPSGYARFAGRLLDGDVCTALTQKHCPRHKHRHLGREQEITAPAVLLFKGAGSVNVASGGEGAAILYCEGEPLNEPVARMGPFVMNTRAELQQAVEDYNAGRLAT